jgi:hypothetical protein
MRKLSAGDDVSKVGDRFCKGYNAMRVLEAIGLIEPTLGHDEVDSQLGMPPLPAPSKTLEKARSWLLGVFVAAAVRQARTSSLLGVSAIALDAAAIATVAKALRRVLAIAASPPIHSQHRAPGWHAAPAVLSYSLMFGAVFTDPNSRSASKI